MQAKINALHSHPAGQKPVHYIDQPEDMLRCVQDLAAQESIAFDLEFDNNLRSYGVTLCLIQVATPVACYVIDPFAAIDLSSLYALFEDERIQKIVHAPGEDLRLLHSLSCYPKNLFDTEVPAKLLNYEQTSLSVMLQEKLGHTMSKQQQKSNWLQRPLTDLQIQYAADDVAYLHALRAILIDEAAQKGLMPFVEDDQAAMSTTIYKQEAKESFLKPADFYTLSPREQYVLNALYLFRDGVAREINKPAFQVMDDEFVRDLAADRAAPRKLLTAVGVHRKLKNDGAVSQLNATLKKARDEAAHLSDQLPPRERLSNEQYAAKEKAARDKARIFTPIQQALAARFGTYAARFMFSNSAVSDLLTSKVRVGEMKPYRRDLLRDIAKELKIDLRDYE